MPSSLKRDARILIAGAGGFIGGHLTHRLASDGYTDVLAVDLKPTGRWWQPAENALSTDLSDLAQCHHAVRDRDIILNLAGDMGGMGFIESHRGDCMLSVLINTHLLVAARAAGVARYFYASSACVYPASRQDRPNAPPLKESDAYPAACEDGYGWEKLFSERMCRHFLEDFGVPTRVARYHNVYGPHGAWMGGREKAPAAMCRKVAEAKILGNREIEIWGDGQQTRSFMYVDDCIEGTLRIAASDEAEPLNLGSSTAVSINQLVDAVELIAGATLRRRYVEGPLGVRGRSSDNSLIARKLRWTPTVSLAQGLEPTYRWVHDQVARHHLRP